MFFTSNDSYSKYYQDVFYIPVEFENQEATWLGWL